VVWEYTIKYTCAITVVLEYTIKYTCCYPLSQNRQMSVILWPDVVGIVILTASV